MISEDWRVARAALQILAEQGPGMTMARAQTAEEQAYRATVKALGG